MLIHKDFNIILGFVDNFERDYLVKWGGVGESGDFFPTFEISYNSNSSIN